MERLEPVLLDEAARPGDRPRRRQLDPGGGADRGRRCRSPSPTSSPACAASTARCPRRSTGSSPTSSPSYLFLHSDEAIENLRAEGIADERMHFVGNTMIDTLVALEERFRAAGDGRAARGRARRVRRSSPCTAPPSSTGRCWPRPMHRAGRAGARDAGRLPGPPAHPQDDGGGSSPSTRACCSPSRSATSTSSRCSPTPAPCSPTPAASRRRRPTSASPASPCATTPSGR